MYAPKAINIQYAAICASVGLLFIVIFYTMPEGKYKLWGFAKKVQEAADTVMGVTRIEKEKPTYSLPDRSIDLDDDDIGELRNVLYSEISNREPEKQKTESRAIINTALNRIPQYKEKGKNLKLAEVLRQPNQYQGYQPDKEDSQYRIAKDGKGNAKKLAVIDEVLEELKSGKLKDDIGGAVYYIHENDGRLTVKDGKLYE